MTKTCFGCGVAKPLDAEHFGIRKRDESGQIVRYTSRCRPCHNAYGSARRAQARFAPVEPRHYLPVAPLLPFIERELRMAVMRDEPNPAGRIAAMCGTTPRSLYAWVNHERRSIKLENADKVLIGLDLCWWEVWTEGEYPREAAIWQGEPVKAAA